MKEERRKLKTYYEKIAITYGLPTSGWRCDMEKLLAFLK